MCSRNVNNEIQISPLSPFKCTCFTLSCNALCVQDGLSFFGYDGKKEVLYAYSSSVIGSFNPFVTQVEGNTDKKFVSRLYALAVV